MSLTTHRHCRLCGINFKLRSVLNAAPVPISGRFLWRMRNPYAPKPKNKDTLAWLTVVVAALMAVAIILNAVPRSSGVGDPPTVALRALPYSRKAHVLVAL